MIRAGHVSCFQLKRLLSTLLKRDIVGIKPQDLIQASIDQNDTQGRKTLIHRLVNSTNPYKRELYEQLVPDFSYYFKLDPDVVDNQLLLRLIEVNPGRVLSNVELYKKHHVENDDVHFSALIDFLVEDLAMKYIGRESGDLNEFFTLADQYKGKTSSRVEELNELILNEMILRDDLFMIRRFFTIGDSVGSYNSILVRHLDTLSGKFALIEYVKSLIEKGKDISKDMWMIEVVLSIFNSHRNQLESFFKQKNGNGNDNDNDTLNFDNLVFKILQKINESKLDVSLGEMNLRTLLLETYGIAIGDMELTLKKYNQYEGLKDYDGSDKYKKTMVKVFAYRGIRDDKPVYISMAEAIQPSTTTTVSVLQILILLKCYFNIDEGLNLYNYWINKVSSTINEGKSQKGLLTEAIILGCLINNDREFAMLLFNKAIDHNILQQEYEISRVKKWFKSYSDCFIESEDWQNHAHEKMKRIYLNFVEAIGSCTIEQSKIVSTATLGSEAS
ncbi:hypothetical protein KGF56_000466 [Candida oxycetoniae]|uniref:Uncharacterized protein n=1 Tax=Candida oxycetoniae TaxID=497107 RepID=A0AAI9T1C0_9ASCO|nr:uncharacterized protein KGF56_000466 [Candida oxycetoniae]KAI3406620.2 hypothetical protein KGF56_000466 [Candida oxycetoniae]